MTLPRILRIISALLLLLCSGSILLNLVGSVLNGVPRNPLFLSYVGILTLTFAVTFVASYRQIFTPFPKLIITAFCLVLISQILGYILLQHALSDPMTAQMNDAIKEGIRQGLADGTLPKGKGFEDQLLDNSFKLTDLFKSLGFYIAMFILPLYVNLRTDPATLINP